MYYIIEHRTKPNWNDALAASSKTCSADKAFSKVPYTRRWCNEERCVKLTVRDTEMQKAKQIHTCGRQARGVNLENTLMC